MKVSPWGLNTEKKIHTKNRKFLYIVEKIENCIIAMMMMTMMIIMMHACMHMSVCMYVCM